jgi:hypothetical protein
MLWLLALRLVLAAGFEDPTVVDPEETQRLVAALATASPAERTALEIELEVRVQLAGRRLVPLGGEWVSLPGLIRDNAEVPPAEWATWHLGPETELWVLAPNAGPARRVDTFRVLRSRFGECGGFEGIVLDVGERPEGSVIHVGPPPASWLRARSDVPSAADVAWRASVDARLAALLAPLGPVEVATVSSGRTAYARVVQRQERPAGFGFDELVTELVFVDDAAPRVRHSSLAGYGTDSRPVWLFDIDGDGSLDVVSTLCEADIRTLDGEVLSKGENPCCGC